MKIIIIISGYLLLSKVFFTQNDFNKCWKDTYEQMKKRQEAFDLREWHDCVIGKQIPPFEFKTFSEQTVSSKDFNGKVIVINFWFVECHPCIAELPALNKLVKEYKDKNVVFLAPTYETKQWLDSSFFNQYKFDFIIIPDATNLIKRFGETGYPTTYIIDRSGRVREVFNGGPIDIKAETETYLKANPIIDELLKAQ